MNILRSNITKQLTAALISGFMLYTLVVPAYATSSVLTWHLAGSDKHLDWGGSTTYQAEFNASVTVWNNHKPGVIRQDDAATVRDVTISDYYEVSTTAGVTSSSGTIKFNTYKMNTYTTDQLLNVYIHELGHALGLAHNQPGDVMYAYVSTTTSLSANDKASYDESYNQY